MMHFTNISSYTHQGKRPKQEDTFKSDEGLLIVCDGIGGLTNGDKASAFVCETLSGLLRKDLPLALKCSQNYISKAILKTRNGLTEEAKRLKVPAMGTTLVFAFICDGKLFASHLGDSRLYVFDKMGKIKWRTKDHSLIQQLIDKGEMTEQEASVSLVRAIITLSMSSNKYIDKAFEVIHLENVEEGDLLLLLTDGVVESWTDEALSKLVSDLEGNTGKIISEIQRKCELFSKDNNTAVLARI